MFDNSRKFDTKRPAKKLIARKQKKFIATTFNIKIKKMKTTELAQWHEYESSGETLVSINIVNFNSDPKILNFYMDASFKIVHSANFNKESKLFICEKLPTQANSLDIYKNYFYFMYNKVTGIFAWDDSDSKDKVTVDAMVEKITKSLSSKEKNIKNCFIGGSFIRELKTPKQLETIMTPYSYKGFTKKSVENPDETNLNLECKSSSVIAQCLKIRDSLKQKSLHRTL